MAVNLGETIRDAREKKNWTQDQLAQTLGVSVMTIKNWEVGRHSPKNAIGRIEDVLGVTLRSVTEQRPTGPGIDKASDAQLIGELLTRLSERDATIAELRRHNAELRRQLDNLDDDRTPHVNGERWAARQRLRPVDDAGSDAGADSDDSAD